MRADFPVLVVFNDARHAPVAEACAGTPVITASTTDALAVLRTRALGGMLVFVDGRGPVRSARELLDEYFRRQPMGRVALLSDAPDATIGTQFVILPPRVDVFFTPWDSEAVRTFLRVTAAVPAAAS